MRTHGSTMVFVAGALLTAGATFAQAQDGTVTTSGEPRQLTLPPQNAQSGSDVVDMSALTEQGAASVLPNGRSCPSDTMVIGHALSQGPTALDRLRNRGLARNGATVSAGCIPTASDIDPAPVLTAPPQGGAAVPPGTMAQNGAPVIVGP